MAKKPEPVDIPTITPGDIQRYRKRGGETPAYEGMDAAIAAYRAVVDAEKLPAAVTVASALNDRVATMTSPEPTEETSTHGQVLRLIRGEVTPEDAAANAAKADAAKRAHDAAVDLHESALAACRIGALKSLTDLTEDQALPPLRAELERLLPRARELAPVVEGVADDASALRVSEDVRAAWLELSGIRREVKAVLGAAGSVRKYTGKVEFKFQGKVDTDSSRYATLAEYLGPNEKAINAALGGGAFGVAPADQPAGAEVAAFARAVTSDVVKLGIFTVADAKANYDAGVKVEREIREAEIAAEPQRKGMVNAAAAGR